MANKQPTFVRIFPPTWQLPSLSKQISYMSQSSVVNANFPLTASSFLYNTWPVESVTYGDSKTFRYIMPQQSPWSLRDHNAFIQLKKSAIATFKWVFCPGASSSLYSPVTKTSLCTSSFRHFLLPAGKINANEFTKARKLDNNITTTVNITDTFILNLNKNCQNQ